jgi:lipopolysaccharide transport system ATP-binding protein
MSRTVIQVEGLGKRYCIDQGAQHNALRHLIGDALRAPVRLLRDSNHNSGGQANGGSSDGPSSSTKHRGSPFIWALKDVGFEVKEGEVVGLIGRNGAGKSTLLKILARITRPTEGHAEIRGRVGSLLEVGTGFHPELTGRENVFMSGALLGMRKAEIERKFDEIVAFSEVERFLDTPLKYFSSGMQVRLAFAVAAHLEPEILFADEVLSVGDIAFQKKCLGKMGDVARQGRTIVFVSHDMAAINALCSRCILLKHGREDFDGSTAAATARYYEGTLPAVNGNGDLLCRPRREGSGKARFRSVSVQPLNAAGDEVDLAYPGCDLRIRTDVDCHSEFFDCNLAIIFWDVNGYRVIDTNTAQKGRFVSLRAGQRVRADFLLREVLLKPGTYFISLWLGRWPTEVIDHVDAAALDIIESEETSKHPEIFPGVYLCRFESNIGVI